MAFYSSTQRGALQGSLFGFLFGGATLAADSLLLKSTLLKMFVGTSWNSLSMAMMLKIGGAFLGLTTLSFLVLGSLSAWAFDRAHPVKTGPNSDPQNPPKPSSSPIVADDHAQNLQPAAAPSSASSASISAPVSHTNPTSDASQSPPPVDPPAVFSSSASPVTPATNSSTQHLPPAAPSSVSSSAPSASASTASSHTVSEENAAQHLPPKAPQADPKSSASPVPPATSSSTQNLQPVGTFLKRPSNHAPRYPNLPVKTLLATAADVLVQISNASDDRSLKTLRDGFSTYLLKLKKAINKDVLKNLENFSNQLFSGTFETYDAFKSAAAKLSQVGSLGFSSDLFTPNDIETWFGTENDFASFSQVENREEIFEKYRSYLERSTHSPKHLHTKKEELRQKSDSNFSLLDRATYWLNAINQKDDVVVSLKQAEMYHTTFSATTKLSLKTDTFQNLCLKLIFEAPTNYQDFLIQVQNTKQDSSWQGTLSRWSWSLFSPPEVAFTREEVSAHFGTEDQFEAFKKVYEGKKTLILEHLNEVENNKASTSHQNGPATMTTATYT